MTDVTLLNCTVRDGKLGPAILERVVVDGLSTFDLFIVWGTLFRNVVLKGRLGRVKINQAVAAFVDDAVQRAFDEDREAFYAQTDWAIDIREAEFTEFDCRGIPARLFLRDPESQAVVTRERALGSDWREQVSSSNTFWPFVIDEMFLESGDNDTILVAPRGARRKEYQKLLRDLNELRALGVVEPD